MGGGKGGGGIGQHPIRGEIGGIGRIQRRLRGGKRGEGRVIGIKRRLIVRRIAIGQFDQQRDIGRTLGREGGIEIGLRLQAGGFGQEGGILGRRQRKLGIGEGGLGRGQIPLCDGQRCCCAGRRRGRIRIGLLGQRKRRSRRGQICLCRDHVLGKGGQGRLGGGKGRLSRRHGGGCIAEGRARRHDGGIGGGEFGLFGGQRRLEHGARRQARQIAKALLRGLIGCVDLLRQGKVLRAGHPGNGQRGRDRRDIAQRLIRHEIRDGARPRVIDGTGGLRIACGLPAARIGLRRDPDRIQQAVHQIVRRAVLGIADLVIVQRARHGAQAIGNQRAGDQRGQRLTRIHAAFDQAIVLLGDADLVEDMGEIVQIERDHGNCPCVEQNRWDSADLPPIARSSGFGGGGDKGRRSGEILHLVRKPSDQGLKGAGRWRGPVMRVRDGDRSGGQTCGQTCG